MVISVFGERFKKLRNERNLTQSDIAKMFNVTDRAVSTWEVGKAQPSYDVLIKLADYFDVSTDYLLGFKQDDANTLNRLKMALKEAGMWDDNIDDMKLEDFAKSIKIMNMLNDDKDTDK